ncbi:MAG: hypothetical protein AVDCRST_MAG73-1925 [uncultured Thermomicrobiales bacterium]|uniref:Uncharacterized protein n=1 Tax=uncultured Thermomicrobiales bacterium TaxID=1645740 RepID=A0A6J4U5E2_9BACT|nr:MAG: hypothetical protein AVDCRST_MAG73-1925 [uncultured Thermomicrobiales bacterium]
MPRKNVARSRHVHRSSGDLARDTFVRDEGEKPLLLEQSP